MTKQRCCVHKHRQTSPSVPTPASASVGEPVMRRWVHPVEATPPTQELSRLLQQQTELLLEIRALLTASPPASPDKK